MLSNLLSFLESFCILVNCAVNLESNAEIWLCNEFKNKKMLFCCLSRALNLSSELTEQREVSDEAPSTSGNGNWTAWVEKVWPLEYWRRSCGGVKGGWLAIWLIGCWWLNVAICLFCSAHTNVHKLHRSAFTVQLIPAIKTHETRKLCSYCCIFAQKCKLLCI